MKVLRTPNLQKTSVTKSTTPKLQKHVSLKVQNLILQKRLAQTGRILRRNFSAGVWC